MLETRDPARLLTRGEVQRDRPVVFLIPGQGAQYVGMAHAIYQAEPVFRTVVDHCAELLKPQLGLDLRTVLYPDFQDKETRRQGDHQFSR